MTSFAHVDYPSEHPGLVRAGRAAQSLKEAVHGFNGTRAGASLLLAAIVAALLVVAWIVMWAVAVASLAMLATPARHAAAALRVGFRRWTAARKQAAEDDQLWKLALTDARVMADISRAMNADASRDIKAYY